MSSMKFLQVLMLAGLLLGIPQIASAHVLKTSGTVGAVIHIDPADDPIVGQPSTLFFEFKDKLNKFRVQECDCQVVISRAGQELTRQPLVPSPEADSTQSTYPYIFPEKGIYTIKVEGRSPSQSFEPFQLSYELRVSRIGQAQKRPIPRHSVHIIGVGIILIYTAFLLIKEKRKAKKHNQEIK